MAVPPAAAGCAERLSAGCFLSFATRDNTDCGCKWVFCVRWLSNGGVLGLLVAAALLRWRNRAVWGSARVYSVTTGGALWMGVLLAGRQCASCSNNNNKCLAGGRWLVSLSFNHTRIEFLGWIGSFMSALDARVFCGLAGVGGKRASERAAGLHSFPPPGRGSVRQLHAWLGLAHSL